MVKLGYAWGYYMMHFITMDNSILPFSVVLIRTILLFSDLGVLSNTLEPRRSELSLLSHASSFLHVRCIIFAKKYFLKILLLIPTCIKKKKVFLNDGDCSWLAVEPRIDVVVEVPSYWGAVSLGLNNNCSTACPAP